MGTTSPDQFTRWHVDLGEIHSVFNIRIQFKKYEDTDSKRKSFIFTVEKYDTNVKLFRNVTLMIYMY